MEIKRDGTPEENFKSNWQALKNWEESEEGKKVIEERRIEFKKMEEIEKKKKKFRFLKTVGCVIGGIICIGILAATFGAGPSPEVIKEMLDANKIPYK